MAKRVKQTMALLLSVIMLIGVMPMTNVFATDIVDSGTCGDNLTWTLDDEGTLTISGTGDMYDWEWGQAPWYGVCEFIKTIDINRGVTIIGEYAFSDCQNLTTVIIPDSVTNIGYSAFRNCRNLTNIEIPSSVTTIGACAFLGCKSLTSVTIPVGVTVINTGVFAYCVGLTNVTFLGNVTRIEERAFCGCGFTDITLPDSLKGLDSDAFSYCDALTNITIPSGMTSIGEYAFAECSSLTSVTIPDSVTSIDNSAFEHCESLADITIPDSVTSIGSLAFAVCRSLANITISDMLTSIGYDVFYDTAFYNNESNWENDVLYIGNYLLKCRSNVAGNYTVKENTKVIADSAFFDCAGLTSITIPDSVTSIDNSAFEHCESLADITIPDGVTSIGDWAFVGCKSLTDVYYNGTEEEWNTIAIGSHNDELLNATIHYNYVVACQHKNTTEYARQDATCTEGGFTAGVYCNDCKEWIDGHEILSKLDHAYTGDIKNNNDGTHSFKCVNGCNNYGNVADCTYGEWTIAIPQTCTIDGLRKHVCTVCGYETTEAIASEGHKFTNYIADNNATCLADGTKTAKCDNCTAKDTVTDANTKLDHSYTGEIKNNENGTHSFKCVNGCNQYGGTVECVYDDWIVLKEATVWEEGLQKAYCICGNEKSEIIEIPPMTTVSAESEEAGVSVSFADGTYPNGNVEVVVDEIDGGEEYEIPQFAYAGRSILNIKTLVDDVEVEPTKPVLVRVRIPDDFNKTAIKIWHINDETGEKEIVSDYRIEGDYVEFLAYSFSVYVIVDESSESTINPSENCSCNCHKTGILHFFWAMLNFFRRIFGMTQYRTCACGKMHW